MKRLITLILALGLLLSQALTARAGYPDPGPCKTNIFVQNVGANPETITFIFTNGETGGEAWHYTTEYALDRMACRYLLYSQFGVGTPWAGAVEMSSTEAVVSIVNMLWDTPGAGTNGAPTAGTYTTIDSGAATVYLPSLAVRPDSQISHIIVQNTEGALANVTLHFLDRNGSNAGQTSVSIPANSERTFFLETIQPNFSATSNLGSAYITSDRRVAAVVTNHWWDSSEAYSGFAYGATTLWVPSVFRKYCPGSGQWNYNATIFQNLGDVAATVLVQFIAQNGSITHQFSDMVQPKAAVAYNTMYQGTMDPIKWQDMVNALGDFWQGTIRVTCTNAQRLVGLSFLFARDAATDCASFGAIRDVDAASEALACPAVYRKVNSGVWEQWSTTLVQNLSSTSGTLHIQLYRSDGSYATDTTIGISANGSVRLNLKDGLELVGGSNPWVLTEIGDYFSGSMYIEPSSSLRIIGVANVFWPPDSRASGYDAFSVP